MIYIEIILYLLNNGARAINAVSLASFFVHVRQEKKRDYNGECSISILTE